ncbi:MAG TPA: hypothetical protein VLJ80_15385 [Solirubrobacteraceae bacterium]|nr:hypothetical protein [Solirubrobacteraceae bacterium]
MNLGVPSKHRSPIGDPLAGSRRTRTRVGAGKTRSATFALGLLFAALLSAAAPAAPLASAAALSTSLSPGANLGSALNSATPGQTICLNPGTYAATTWREHGGREGSPVSLTSCDPALPATIQGRFVTSGSASWVDITNLKFLFSGSESVTVVLGTPHELFSHNDVSGAGQTICINGVSWGGSTFSYSTIDHNAVHNCGKQSGVVKSGCDITCQGIYLLGGPGDVVSNNWCWEAAARCYQVRGERGGYWHNNVAADSREGWIFGDLTPTGNRVEQNIVAAVANNSAYTYGSVGSGNVFANNCISKSFGNNAGVLLSNNIVVPVQFVNAAAHDYALSAASINDPCRGYAAQGGHPGPAGEAVPTEEPPAETTPPPTETTPPPPPPTPVGRPATPTGLTAGSGGGATPAITLKWSANPSADSVTSYSVFRAGDENIEGKGPGVAWSTTPTLSMTNRMLVHAKDWLCYRLSATNAQGEGPKGPPVCTEA